jgi:uncharacterized protein with NRDE domain
MCLIAWNWQPQSTTPLVLIANRDEFYARAALPLHWWESAPILAGKDLQAGGTWLGLSRSGRLAALTNYRSATPPRSNTPSRGELVADFLKSDGDAAQFLQTLAPRAGAYNPFNLLVFDGTQLLGLESRNAQVITMLPGIGAVSNADFQTPWPKLTQLTARLHASVNAGETDTQNLLTLLHDRSMPADAALPHTGVPLALERALSPAFITTPSYGTRACSVVTLGRAHAEFVEQSFDASGLVSQNQQAFPLPSH